MRLTQNPTTLFTARAGVLRVKSIRDPQSVGFDATTLGLPAYMTDDTGTRDFPRFSAQCRVDCRRGKYSEPVQPPPGEVGVGLNRPHVLTGSFDYQLPAGRNRVFGKNMNRVLDAAIEGWEISSILTVQSGAALPATVSDYHMWDGAVQRPNLTGNPVTSGSVSGKLNSYFNANPFNAPEDFEFGSAPRYLPSCRGPALVNQDVTLVKNFNIRKRQYVQLKMEAYSPWNTPQWELPNVGFGDTTFGQISTAGGNRTLQLAVKFHY